MWARACSSTAIRRYTPDPFFFFRLFGEEDPRRRLPSLFLQRYFIRGCVCMIDVNVYDVLGGCVV